MVATVSTLSLIISKQKSKVKQIFEIFEFSYLALARVNSKTRKSRKDSSQFQD